MSSYVDLLKKTKRSLKACVLWS